MKHTKPFFIAALLVSLMIRLQGQSTTPNYNSTDERISGKKFSFWYEGNFAGTIKRTAEGKPRWQYQLDWQYRRMSDASYVSNGSYYNPFKDPFQSVFRPWIHYWVKPGAVRISLSPLGHWGTWTSPSEGTQKYFPELRICPQVTLIQKFDRLEIQQRYRGEIRLVGTSMNAKASIGDLFAYDKFPDTGHKFRFRYMMRFNYPINRKSINEKGAFYLTAWDEIFLGIGKNTVDTKVFDQNRLIMMVGHRLNTTYPIRIELGYTWQYAPRYNVAALNNLNWESNNALQVYLIIDDFHSFLKFKKKAEAEAPKS